MSEADSAASRASAKGVLNTLVTIRMIRLFILLRRGGILAQRRRFDLSEIEWRIMIYLGDDAPLSLNGLAELLMQDRGQLSRAVKAMVARGLLTRERKPGGPKIEIELSDKGRALHGQLVDWVVERDARLTEGLDPADIAALWRTTDAMIARAEDLIEEEQRASG